MAKMDPKSYDYREVACPQCGAKATAYCMRPSGHSGPFVYPHEARRKFAQAQWKKEEIELYGRIITDWDDEPKAEAGTGAILVETATLTITTTQLSFF
jgi:hypothetical protein